MAGRVPAIRLQQALDRFAIVRIAVRTSTC
jgi:hypothetical protein